MGWVSRLYGKTVGLDTAPLIFPRFPIRSLARRYPRDCRGRPTALVNGIGNGNISVQFCQCLGNQS